MPAERFGIMMGRRSDPLRLSSVLLYQRREAGGMPIQMVLDQNGFGQIRRIVLQDLTAHMTKIVAIVICNIPSGGRHKRLGKSVQARELFEALDETFPDGPQDGFMGPDQ